VVTGGKDLNGLDTIGRARFVEGVEQARVEALLEEDVGGEGGLHHLLRYSSAAANETGSRPVRLESEGNG
jgi:hypothetical protein